MNPSNPFHARTWLAAAVLAMAGPVAWAASPAGTPATKASIEASYQRDRAACQGLGNPEQRTSCMRDAGASRAQALRLGTRNTTTPEQRERNALQRCQHHTAPESRTICERMARGEGQVSGSVEGGGTIRELVTQVPAPMPAPATEPMPAPTASPMMNPVPTPLPAAPSAR